MLGFCCDDLPLIVEIVFDISAPGLFGHTCDVHSFSPNSDERAAPTMPAPTTTTSYTSSSALATLLENLPSPSNALRDDLNRDEDCRNIMRCDFLFLTSSCVSTHAQYTRSCVLRECKCRTFECRKPPDEHSIIDTYSSAAPETDVCLIALFYFALWKQIVSTNWTSLASLLSGCNFNDVLKTLIITCTSPTLATDCSCRHTS